MANTDNEEKNYRIRFRNEKQLRLIQRAARIHGLSFNTFITVMGEAAAKLLLKRGAKLPTDILADAVSEVCRGTPSIQPDTPSTP